MEIFHFFLRSDDNSLRSRGLAPWARISILVGRPDRITDCDSSCTEKISAAERLLGFSSAESVGCRLDWGDTRQCFGGDRKTDGPLSGLEPLSARGFAVGFDARATTWSQSIVAGPRDDDHLE